MISKAFLCTLCVLLFSGLATSADVSTTRPANEYYVGGDLVRPGVYSLAPAQGSVLEAIKAAEPKESKADYRITITRHTQSHKLDKFIGFSSLNALRGCPEEDVDLAPGDSVLVKIIKG